MSLLRQAVAVVTQWDATREEDRGRCVSLLESVVHNMNEAVKIWEDFLKDAPDSGDRFTPVLWLGPERSKQLHRLYLKEKEAGRKLTDLTGIPFRDTLGISAEIDIVQAYGQLETDEKGTDRAREAIRIINDRKQRVSDAISSL